MARTKGENNVLRGELAGSAIAHTNEAMSLLEGEDFTATYALSADPPTVTFSGTLRLEKSYDPLTDKLDIYPYFEPTT